MCHIRGVEMKEIMKGLRQPFPINQTYVKLVSTIQNKGKDYGYVVPYIKLYSIKNRLDEVVGPGYWKLETRDGREGFIVSLSLRITYDGKSEWVSMEHGAKYTQKENQNSIDPVKGAISQGIKKAAQLWDIGTYLQSVEGVWIEVTEKNGKKYLNAVQEEKVKQEIERRIYKRPLSKVHNEVAVTG